MINSCYESMQKDLNFQLELKKKIDRELRKYKKYEGYYLTIHTKKGYRYYYQASHRNAEKEKLIYLGSADNPEVLRLQEFHYLKETGKRCEKNIRFLQNAVDNYRDIDPSAVICESGLAYRDNLNVGRNLFSCIEVNEWKENAIKLKNEYPQPYPKAYNHVALSGEAMRSRGEVIIANTLDYLGIPYVYEMPLFIGDEIFYPDFTILDPVTGEMVIIEYMGLYVDESYRTKNKRKIDAYFFNGWVLGRNMFIFMDPEEGNIDSNKIYRVLKSFFSEK